MANSNKWVLGNPEKIVIGKTSVEMTESQVGTYTLVGTEGAISFFHQQVGEERFLYEVKNNDFNIVKEGGVEDLYFSFFKEGEKRFEVSYGWNQNLLKAAKPIL